MTLNSVGFFSPLLFHITLDLSERFWSLYDVSQHWLVHMHKTKVPVDFFLVLTTFNHFGKTERQSNKCTLIVVTATLLVIMATKIDIAFTYMDFLGLIQ